MKIFKCLFKLRIFAFMYVKEKYRSSSFKERQKFIDRKFYSSQLYDIASAPKILFYQFSDQCGRSINASRSLRGISRQ